MKWIFEGRVYSSLKELSGKTMSEGNKPEPVFTLEDLKLLQRYDLHSRYNSLEIDFSGNGQFVEWEDIENLFVIKNFDVGEGAESESEL